MFKVSISHKIDGMTVDSDTFFEKLKEKAIENGKHAFAEQAKVKLRTVRCPEHNQSPTVALTNTGNLRIGGCCEALIKLANQKLKR